MAKQRRLFNKTMMLAEVECSFNKLLDCIDKQDKEIEELNRKLKLSEKNKVELAKEVLKYFENRDKDTLDIIFIKKHDALVSGDEQWE